MASHDSEDSRIHDGVRDSKIRLDSTWKFNQKAGSFTSELNRSKGGNGCHEEECYLSQYITSRIRMKIRFFNGAPDRLVDWADTVEEFFVQMDIPEQLKCKIASYAIEGVAEQWWQQLQLDRLEVGKSKVYLWQEMKYLMFSSFLPTSCLRKILLQSVSSNQSQEELILFGINHISSPKRGNTDSSDVEGKPKSSTATNATLKHNDEADSNTSDSDMGSDGVRSTKTVLPSATIDAKQKVKGSEASNHIDECSKEMNECDNSYYVHTTKVVISERSYSAMEVKQREGVVVVKHLKADRFMPTTCSTKRHNQLNIHGTNAARLSKILNANFDPGGNCLGKLQWFWQHAFLLHNLELEQRLMEESQLELLEDFNTPVIKNPIAMRSKSTEQREQNDVKEMKLQPTQLLVVSTIAKPTFTQDQVNQLKFRRINESKLLLKPDMDKSLLFNDSKSLTCLIYGEFMTSTYFSTKIVSLLFDPGGIFRLTRELSTKLSFVMLAGIMSFRNAQTILRYYEWSDDKMIKNVDGNKVYLCKLLDGLVLVIMMFVCDVKNFGNEALPACKVVSIKELMAFRILLAIQRSCDGIADLLMDKAASKNMSFLYLCDIILTYYCAIKSKQLRWGLKVEEMFTMPLPLVFIWPNITNFESLLSGREHGHLVVQVLLTIFNTIKGAVEDKVCYCFIVGRPFTNEGRLTAKDEQPWGMMSPKLPKPAWVFFVTIRNRARPTKAFSIQMVNSNLSRSVLIFIVLVVRWRYEPVKCQHETSWELNITSLVSLGGETVNCSSKVRTAGAKVDLKLLLEVPYYEKMVISVARFNFVRSGKNRRGVTSPHTNSSSLTSACDEEIKVKEHIGVWCNKKVTVNGLLEQLHVTKDLYDNCEVDLLQRGKNNVEPSFYIHGRVNIRAERVGYHTKLVSKSMKSKQSMILPKRRAFVEWISLTAILPEFLCSSASKALYGFTVGSNFTRGRVIPLVGWNVVINTNTEEKFIKSKCSVVTISLCLKIVCEKRRLKKTLKLFHKMVNGLDPPLDVDDKCARPRCGILRVRSWTSFMCGGDGLM